MAALIFFTLLLISLGALVLKSYRFLTKGPDFGALEANGSVNELIQTLVNEINTALSLNQTEVLHKFNPAEPPIDGEVAANVTFKVAQVIPCVILFYYESNHDVRIVLQRMEGN